MIYFDGVGARQIVIKEASLYERLEKDNVRCFLCNHHCIISVGKYGICGVRENREGTLYTCAYGELIAQNIDPIEKKPLYHFLPGFKLPFDCSDWM